MIGYEMDTSNYEIKLWTWINTPKATKTIVKALKYQMRIHIY